MRQTSSGGKFGWEVVGGQGDTDSALLAMVSKKVYTFYIFRYFFLYMGATDL